MKEANTHLISPPTIHFPGDSSIRSALSISRVSASAGARSLLLRFANSKGLGRAEP